jgi:hypothetical protein
VYAVSRNPDCTYDVRPYVDFDAFFSSAALASNDTTSMPAASNDGIRSLSDFIISSVSTTR